MHSLPNKVAHLVRTAPRRRPPWRPWLCRFRRDLLYIATMTIGWVAGNVLALLGCVVAAFLLIADGDFSVFMAQIENVAARFAAADPVRRASFEHEVLTALAICGTILFAIRLPRFVMRLRLELSQETDHAG